MKNEAGDKLRKFCQENQMFSTNTSSHIQKGDCIMDTIR